MAKKQMFQQDVFDLRFKRNPHLRWGQAIVNEYFSTPCPELYYEEDESAVLGIITEFFDANQIPFS